MKVVYYKCGGGLRKTVNLIGYTARFVKIQLVGIKEYLNLCEIEIYGQPGTYFTLNFVKSQ